MRGPRLYLKLAGISIQSQLQYRSSLLMQTIGQFFLYVTEFAAMAGLFSRFGSIAGWNLSEAAVLYGLADLAFSSADALARGFDLLGSLVSSGDFDRVLARPASPFIQTLGQELTLRRFGRLLVGASVFAWGWASSGASPGPAGLAAVTLGWAGAVAVFVSIITIQGALSFWTVEGLEIDRKSP